MAYINVRGACHNSQGEGASPLPPLYPPLRKPKCLYPSVEYPKIPTDQWLCRYEIKNQALWEEIKFVLDNFADSFSQMFLRTIELCETHKTDQKAIPILYQSVLLSTKIFHRCVIGSYAMLYLLCLRASYDLRCVTHETTASRLFYAYTQRFVPRWETNIIF